MQDTFRVVLKKCIAYECVYVGVYMFVSIYKMDVDCT